MHHRTFMLAAVAAGTFLLPVGDAVAPTTLKYKIVQRTEQSIDASAMGQGEQKVMMGYSAYLTVELDDSASGRAVKVKVDSLRTDADAEPTFAAMLSRSDGASGSGFIDEKGELVAFSETNADSSATPSALRGLLSSLFPAVKPSAAPGQAWSDTTESSDTTNGMPSARRSYVNYKASEGATVNGQKTLKLEVDGTYSVGGTSDQGISFEGTGTQTGIFQRVSAGYLVDGTFNDMANMTLTIPQSPDPIPMSTVSAVTITLLQ